VVLNPLEPSGTPEDSTGSFGVRNHTIGYAVQGAQWLEINTPLIKLYWCVRRQWLRVGCSAGVRFICGAEFRLLYTKTVATVYRDILYDITYYGC